MFCSNCGSKNEGDARFCSGCGKELKANEAGHAGSHHVAPETFLFREQKESGVVISMSVVGFVFGLIGMLGSFIPFIGSIAFFIGIPAAIISGIALGVAYAQDAKKTFAVVALTISLIGVIISGWQYFTVISLGKKAEEQVHKMMYKNIGVTGGVTIAAARREAYSNLEALRLLQEQFFAENGRYAPPRGGNFNYNATPNIPDNGIEDTLAGFRPGGCTNCAFPYGLSFMYSIVTIDTNGDGLADRFTATATGVAGTRVAGDVFTINEQNIKNW